MDEDATRDRGRPRLVALGPGSGHERCVDDWLGRVESSDASAGLRLLAKAIAALWARAHVTLGDLTLTAIVHRVLTNAKRRHPQLRGLPLEASEASLVRLAADDQLVLDGDLRPAVRATMVELLTVIGALTAEVLTPALHEELRNVTGPERPSADRPTSP